MVVARAVSAPTSDPERAQKPSGSGARSSGGQTVSQMARRTWCLTSVILASVVSHRRPVNTALIFLAIASRLAPMDGALGTMSLGGV